MARATAYSLGELIACAERELGLREKIYPQRVRDGRMSRQFADDQIGKMAEIVRRLRELAQADVLV
jgi:hypothetical protein